MATPGSRLVCETITPWYHCISRCVRRAHLCGEGARHRKQWIQERLQQLVGTFAVECAGFSIMDNHLHLLLRLDSGKARNWPAREVARRWFDLCPLRDISGNPLPITEAGLERLAADLEWIEAIRTRLASLSWFMKFLKEPLARMANREDGCSGAFWEGRFRSVPVPDEASLLATAAYIDLNPVAAAAAATPEESDHTSLRTRLDHCQANGTAHTLHDNLSTLTRNPAQEAGLWLLPVDDNRAHGAQRAGLHEGLTLSCYLRLVDSTSRMVRAGKASLEADMAPLFHRLKLDQSTLESTLVKLFKQSDRERPRAGMAVYTESQPEHPARAAPKLRSPASPVPALSVPPRL
jgi:hypothetical protein